MGRLRSSTITCSWVILVATSRRQVFWVPLSYRPAAYSALTLSAKMWTSSPLASTTASTGVVRSSGSTDFLETPATQAPASPGLFYTGTGGIIDRADVAVGSKRLTEAALRCRCTTVQTLRDRDYNLCRQTA